MTERPILFNAWTVRAIHDGATHTRRPMKDPPECMPEPCGWYNPTLIHRGQTYPGKAVYGTYNDDQGWKSPFGAPGDLLVPLTTWATLCQYNHLKPTDLPDYAPIFTPWDASVKWCPDYCKTKKRPGRFMPTKFRFVLPRLLVKRVWVERVQSISEADAIAEGVRLMYDNPNRMDRRDPKYREGFRTLWDSIYADKYPWAGNPWVWACEFEVKPLLTNQTESA